jgi:hypothetical protein
MGYRGQKLLVVPKNGSMQIGKPIHVAAKDHSQGQAQNLLWAAIILMNLA